MGRYAKGLSALFSGGLSEALLLWFGIEAGVAAAITTAIVGLLVYLVPNKPPEPE